MPRKRYTEEEQIVGILKQGEVGTLNSRQTSQLAKDLSCRIRTNQMFGDADLNAWILDKLKFRKGERLMDVGCGTGTYTISFAKHIETDWSCTGVDISPESLRTAEKASSDSGLKINFVLKNMDQLNSSTDSTRYDMITIMYALYYSKNAVRTLNHLANMLNPEGRLAVLGPYMDNNKEWFDFLNRFMLLPEKILQSSSRFVYEEVLPFAWAHFDVTTCFRFVNHICIPSLEDLKRYWKSNTYYEPKYNKEFLKHAHAHFSKNKSFTFSKTAMLILMNNRKTDTA